MVTPAYSTAAICSNFWGQCNTAAAGTVGLSVGASSIRVWTTAVTAQSQIFVQEDSSSGSILGITCDTKSGRSYLILNRTPGVSFEIVASSTTTVAPACLNYHILN